MAPLAERSLEDAVDRFEAACDGRIIYIGLPWKAFEDFLAALNDYWESIKGRSLPESVEYEISKMFEIRRRLLSQPLNPSNQESGIADLLSMTRADLDESFIEARDQVISKLMVLTAEDHVAADLVQAVTQKFPSFKFEGKSLAILVLDGRELKDAIKKQLVFPGASRVKYLGLSDLRKSEMSDIAFIFGAPEQRLWHTIALEERRKMVSWLYSAPVAKTTINVSWVGHPSFDLSNYTIWPEVALSSANTYGPTTFAIKSDPSGPVIKPIEPTSDPDGVPAILFQFASGGNIAFHPTLGPRPQVIGQGEMDPVIESVSPNRLKQGAVLIFRIDDSEISFIRETARKSLGNKKYDLAKAASDSFKKCVADARGALNDAALMLESAGISSPEYYLQVASDSRWIGAQNYKVAKCIADTFGFAFSEGEYQMINELRVHHRQAGMQANEMIRNSLIKNREWEDAIDRGLHVRLNLGEVGSRQIAMIETIGTVKRLVSKLGVAESVPDPNVAKSELVVEISS